MSTKKNSLALALETGKIKTRPIAEIERDQEETIRWAEDVAKHFPVKVRRGRPPKEEENEPSRSVTVRFPQKEATLIVESAERQGLTISEFVRAAAFHAAMPRVHSGVIRPSAKTSRPKPATSKKVKV